MCVQGHTVEDCATSEEEVVFGAGSCGSLPSWADRGLGKLGKPPFACQTAKPPSTYQAAKYDILGLSRPKLWAGGYVQKCLRVSHQGGGWSLCGWLPQVPDQLE